MNAAKKVIVTRRVAGRLITMAIGFTGDNPTAEDEALVTEREKASVMAGMSEDDRASSTITVEVTPVPSVQR